MEDRWSGGRTGREGFQLGASYFPRMLPEVGYLASCQEICYLYHYCSEHLAGLKQWTILSSTVKPF